MFAQLKSRDNVEYVLRDADGNIKPLFQDYRWTQYLIKAGILSPTWINSESWVRNALLPVLGHYAMAKTARNGVPTVGKALIAGLTMGSGAPAAATYIAVGTGTNAFSAADTTLQTETATSGLSRAAGTLSLVTTTTTNDTAQALKSFSVSGTVAVTESGMFNASSAGTLLARQTFSAINVINGDTLQITWKIQYS